MAMEGVEPPLLSTDHGFLEAQHASSMAVKIHIPIALHINFTERVLGKRSKSTRTPIEFPIDNLPQTFHLKQQHP